MYISLNLSKTLSLLFAFLLKTLQSYDGKR